MKFDKIKENQIKKYSSFDIPSSTLYEIFDKVKNENSEIELMLKFDQLVEEYIVNEIKNDNIDIQIKVIENYSFVKTILVKNPKYNLDIKIINNVYEKAIDILRYKYDKTLTLSRNILINIKYIIDNDFIDRNMDFLEDGEYDISFLRDYIKKNKIDKIRLNEKLECDLDILNKLLYEGKKANKAFVDSICKIFNINNYEELKKMTICKESGDIMKKYEISFLKDHISSLDMTKVELAHTLNTSITTLNAMLNGVFTIDEDKLKPLYKKLDVDSYDEFKNKVLNKKEIKDEFNIGDIDKEKLFEILNYKNMNYRKSLITLLLFSGVTNRTPKQISDFLGISEEYILSVYKEGLNKIKSKSSETKKMKLEK